MFSFKINNYFLFRLIIAKKLRSLNSDIDGSHSSKTAKIRNVNLAALKTPQGPQEYEPCPVTE
jgi:hypothetical protein